MLGEVILIANACGVAWNPVEVLPNEIRPAVQGAQVLDPCRVSAMPKALRDYLAERQRGVRIDMAERDGIWNSSCVLFAGDPNRQFWWPW